MYVIFCLSNNLFESQVTFLLQSPQQFPADAKYNLDSDKINNVRLRHSNV